MKVLKTAVKLLKLINFIGEDVSSQAAAIKRLAEQAQHQH